MILEKKGYLVFNKKWFYDKVFDYFFNKDIIFDYEKIGESYFVYLSNNKKWNE